MLHSMSLPRSLRLIAHPASIAAIALVLANDWLLRPLHPTWLTGKLSDLGVLFFAPYLLAALLALLLPSLLGPRPRLTGGLAFGGALAGFILLKLSPATNTWLVGLSRSAAFPLRAVPDPTDLWTLPALAASAWLWFRPERLPAASHRLPPRRWRLVLLSLAALVAVADAAAPDLGVHCLAIKNGALQASAGYGALYTSPNGGMTWNTLTQFGLPDTCPSKSAGTSLDLTAGATHYRVIIGQSAARSTDGKTWQTLYQAVPLSQAERTYLLRTRSGNLMFSPAPLDALVDPATGNLVLAMGQEGVLVVRPTTAAQIWVTVAAYRHNDLPQSGLGGVAVLLSLELWLAAGAALLWLSTAALRRRAARWQVVLTAIGWLLFVFAALALYPDISAGSETGVVSLLVLLAALVWALSLAVIALARRWKTGLSRILILALLTPLVWLLFLAPYLLWGSEFLPEYWTAAGLAGLILLALTAAAYRFG